MTCWDDQRQMEDLLRAIPPDAVGLDAGTVTPWRSAMKRLLWGMGLLTFRFNFWYLQYLLPLLGAVLLCLGARRLRNVNGGFRWVGRIALLKLIWQVTFLAVSGTRIAVLLEERIDFWTVSAVSCALDFFLLLALRWGVRKAFADCDGAPPRDWLLLGIAAWLGALALAVWATAAPSPVGGTVVAWLRGLASLALYVLLLRLLYQQGKALERRGYAIVPAPVRCPDGAVILLTFLAAALLVGTALLWGNGVPQPEGAGVQPASAELENVRAHLVAVGMPETLAADLMEEDLLLCESAVAVHESTAPTDDGEILTFQKIGGGTVKLHCWAVVLADGSLRFYQTFQWQKLPEYSFQEAFSLRPDGNREATVLTARLTWTQNGQRLAAELPVKWAGGLTAEEMNDWQLWWYEWELNKLGHQQYEPYTVFDLPRDGEEIRGYLAFSRETEGEDYLGGTIFGSCRYFHQDGPQYPYHNLEGSLLGESSLFSFGSPSYSIAWYEYASHVWAAQ